MNRPAGRTFGPIVLGLAAAFALGGCALSPPDAGDTRPVASPTVVQTDAPSPAVPMQPEIVYYPRDSTNGLRLGREVRQVPQADPLRGVVEALLGQPLDPDYSTGWAEGTRLLSVKTAGNVTTVDLSTEARRGDKFGSDFGLVSVDQVVWTVTALVGEDSLVDLTIDGAPPGELWGVTTWDGPRGREEALSVRVHVSIDAPSEGETVTSPVRFSGDAAAHEANVPWVIRDELGAIVREGFTMSEESMRFAPWSFEVPLEPGAYTVEVTGDEVGDTEGFEPDIDSRRFTVAP